MSDSPKMDLLKRFSNWLITKENVNSLLTKNQIFVSNKLSTKLSNVESRSICFINYDYKNEIEGFKVKSNNPLRFPNLVLANIETDFSINELVSKTQTIPDQKIEIKPTISKDEYLRKVEQLKQHIQQGDIYEINYCITFEAPNVIIDPIKVFNKLNAITQAPFASLAKFGSQYIISSSPELYLLKKGNLLTSKPIKGTAKRSADAKEDERIKQTLQNSLKEQTENVMIVDVVRNDLSRIAKRGTVNAEKLFGIESFKQVHQMVSTVSCELKENTTFKETIHATFPMASMTGAPKIRAMQLIDEFEIYNRGPYSGALGYVDENGDFELSVLIRAIFYDEEKRYLSFSVGSAITALCNPEEEYEECLLKAKAMREVLTN